uniref:TNF receptor superfamily member 18 n=2 Tax=Macaca fascicularis TaxID=9541 RepID=A0A2K5WP38_MACFA
PAPGGKGSTDTAGLERNLAGSHLRASSSRVGKGGSVRRPSVAGGDSGAWRPGRQPLRCPRASRGLCTVGGHPWVPQRQPLVACAVSAWAEAAVGHKGGAAPVHTVPGERDTWTNPASGLPARSPWLPGADCGWGTDNPAPLEGRGGASAQLLGAWLVSCPGEECCSEWDCVCVQPEFHCGNPCCTTCQHHPCPSGQGVQPQGKFSFGFRCVDCALGTFSRGHDGHCKPWTDCTQFGFLTVFPGNKTHNAVCVPGSPPAEPPGWLTIILLAVAACVLLLTSAQLGLHIWQLGSQPTGPRETQLLLEVPPSTEDASSCQFPEEERGERLAEEKGRLGDLWV